jgi:hypothetical protein
MAQANIRRENKFKGRKTMRKWYLSIKKVGPLMHALRKKNEDPKCMS